MKITLVQADLDEIKQEQEKNNISMAAKLVSSIRLRKEHAEVSVIKFAVCATASRGVV